MKMMIFDVESNSLHGEGFAVGWVIRDGSEVLSEGYEFAMPSDPIDPWVQEHVLPHLGQPTCNTTVEVRDKFWQACRDAQAKEATLWAYCGWPVEANFLSACVADDVNRAWEGPYPFHEIATVFKLAGWDPLKKHSRFPGETAHNPLGDARQSARLLNACEKIIDIF